MSKPVSVYLLGTSISKHFQEVYRLGHKCYFPSVPKLVHGECTILETIGNYKPFCCVAIDFDAVVHYACEDY